MIRFLNILITALFLFHFSVYADNWELFPFNQSSYYSDNGTTDFDHLYHYTQDSIRDDGTAKTFFFNRFPYSFNHDQCIFESCKIWGDSTEFDSLSSNNSSYYFISGTDTANFFSSAQIGNYWFIRCQNGSQGFDSIKIKCTLNDIALEFGQSDSVKRFLVEAWNNGIAINYFNNYEFELSKSFGLTKWISFRYLLHQNNLFVAKRYSLVGGRVNGNKFGYTLPDFNDYFSCWTPGSTFKFTQGWKYYYCIWWDSVISVINSVDSINVICIGKSSCFDNNITTPDSFSQVEYSTGHVFYKRDYENIFNKTFSQICFEGTEIPYGRKIIRSDYFGNLGISEDPYSLLFSQSSISCYNPLAFPFAINSYAVGPGIIVDFTPYPYYYTSGVHMIGYTCGGQVFGDWKWPNDSISIINPDSNIINSILVTNLVSDFLSFNSETEINCNLYDVSGRLMMRAKTENEKLNVTNYVTGIYIIEIISEGEYKREKFFKY